jgi:hypothetical protein
MTEIPAHPAYEGPNADLVNAVIAFAFSDRILSSVGPDEERDDLIVITDPVRAVQLADGQEDECYFPVELDSIPLSPGEAREEGPTVMNWADLRGECEGLYSLMYRDDKYKNFLRIHYNSVFFLFSVHKVDYVPLEEHIGPLLSSVPGGPYGDARLYRGCIMNYIRDDMMMIIMNRAINGENENFWESVFRVYREGMWPCGWDGAWPRRGKLIAWRCCRKVAGDCLV